MISSVKSTLTHTTEKPALAETRKWFRIFAFPSMAHICDMTAKDESSVYDPRIGGDGNIVSQELPAAKRAFTNTAFVDWAYPTSPDAVRFGFGKSGCYVVTQRINGLDKSVAGFASRDDADKWADWLTKPAGGEVAFSELEAAK